MENSILFQTMYAHAQNLAQAFILDDMTDDEVKEHIFNVHQNAELMEVEYNMFKMLVIKANQVLVEQTLEQARQEMESKVYDISLN